MLRGHHGVVRGCAFSPDGTRLVSASTDDTLKLWDAASGAELATLRGHTESVLGCAFSPDGTRILSAGADKTLESQRRLCGLLPCAQGRPCGRGHCLKPHLPEDECKHTGSQCDLSVVGEESPLGFRRIRAPARCDPSQ